MLHSAAPPSQFNMFPFGHTQVPTPTQPPQSHAGQLGGGGQGGMVGGHPSGHGDMFSGGAAAGQHHHHLHHHSQPPQHHQVQCCHP